ncbi:MAG: excinuclease ABC subunit UvrC [Eubacterium sp.]|nr:excinuclease ABC subunit UvrC [Eubacterium sp.]
MFDIPEELKKLPDRPGVYLMHDKNDAIIYVGKAVSLKNRVRQYFQSSRNKTAKIEKMVSLIDHFEYIITDSELEALVLECNLIKEHRPKYNTMLTDDKSYPYIKVTLGEQFPRVLFSRQMKKDKSKYFGPYTSSESVRETIELLTKLYKIRSCNRVLPRDIGKERPCLNYHIKRCYAPCQGSISEEEYKKNIEEVLRFLNGDYSKILSLIEGKMKTAAEELDFEKATEYRELLKSVQQIAQKQKITHSDGEDKDIIAMAKQQEDAVIQVFFVRGGRMIGREHFYMKIPADDDNGRILNSFVKQFYAGTPYIPKELMLQEEVEDADLLAEWLSEKKGRKVYVRVPQKGAKEKLVELAAKNAKMVLDQDADRIKREEGRTIGAVKEIASLLGLRGIERMEAYDISNTSGYQSVGSMVVFEKGKPQRSDYRKFKLKTVIGPDDYASMREVLTRRFTHGKNELEELEEKGLTKEMGSFTRFPDLIMMDGGKGQVNIALEVLEELGLNIPVCGMVKDDHHRTRGLYFENEELPIDTRSEGFQLITRIQDEAHRFAIEYHRSLRGKGQVHSVLDDIDGIGPKRRKALMKHFVGIEQIKNATEEELAALPEMNAQAAQSVYRFFHS